MKGRIALFALIAAILLQTSWSWYVATNNTYLEYRNVPVTYIDRHETRSCHKGSCKDNLIGLFKTDDGVFFERYIGLYMYRQMHLGEKFELNLRQMDIKQTKRDNILWLFGPIVVHLVTITLWFAMLLAIGGNVIKRYKLNKGKSNDYRKC